MICGHRAMYPKMRFERGPWDQPALGRDERRNAWVGARNLTTPSVEPIVQIEAAANSGDMKTFLPNLVCSARYRQTR